MLSRQINELRTAVINGNLTEVRSRLESSSPNININATDSDGNTLLHLAIVQKDFGQFANNNEIIETLLEYGANPNKQNLKGYSALHLAVQSNRNSIAEMLLLNGANPLLSSTSNPFKDSTPLDFAMRSGNPIMRQCFKAWKVFYNSSFFSSFSLPDKGQNHLDYLLKHYELPALPKLIKKPYPKLLKAFIVEAIKQNQADIIYTIFDNYSDNQFYFLREDQPLIQQIRTCIQQSILLAPSKLTSLKKRLDFFLPIDESKTLSNIESNKNSPLDIIVALKNLDLDLLEKILSDNTSFNFNTISVDSDRNLLDVFYTFNLNLRKIVRGKPNADKENKKYYLSVQIFSLLLKRLDINGRTTNGKTILHIAAEQNAPLLDIAIFLFKGADINLQDNNGRKPSDYYQTNIFGMTANPAQSQHYFLLKDGLHALRYYNFKPLLPRLRCLGYDVSQYVTNPQEDEQGEQKQSRNTYSPSNAI